MRENRLRKSVFVALLPVGTALMATSMASASLSLTNTMDAQTFNSSDTTPNVVYLGALTYNPPPVNTVFKYGNGGATASESVAFNSGVNDGPATGGISPATGSGSVQMSWTWSEPSSGPGSAAFDTDIFPGGVSGNGSYVDSISFDLMVGAGSAQDLNGGNGFMQLFSGFSGTDNLDHTNGAHVYVDGVNMDSGYEDGWELGNPFYSGNDNGTWESVEVTFNAPTPLRALIMQDYDNPSQYGGVISGTETMYLDNLQVTYEVPEPASLGLLGIGVPALLMRRRSKVKGS